MHIAEPRVLSTPVPITGAARKVLDAVIELRETTDLPPTIREIMAHTGIRSTSTVRDWLVRLQRCGWVRFDPRRPRSIVVLAYPADRACRLYAVIEVGVPYVEKDSLACDEPSDETPLLCEHPLQKARS
jgi:repressor LexA